MILTAAVLGGLGLACMIMRGSMLGVLIGAQVLILGATTMMVIAGNAAGAPVSGHIYAIFVLVGGVVQLVVGLALAVRMFILKKKTSLSELRELRH